MNILAIDIGGTNFKFHTQRNSTVVKVPSGPHATPEQLMAAIHENSKGWTYDHVSIGYPGPVLNNTPLKEPANLAPEWRQFSFVDAFDGKPVRVINDAAMQALGSYESGRMLFLGLGTGLGSALVVDGMVLAMEIAHLPWKKGKTYEDFLGDRGLEHKGRKAWQRQVIKAIDDLRAALVCDNIVLGGGNAKLMKKLPQHVRLGSNANAFKGAFRMWSPPRTASPRRSVAPEML